MIFGAVLLEAAEGAILAHSVRAGARRLAKGRMLEPADVEALRDGGIETVEVARPEPGDVHEDEAARRCAAAIAVPGSGLVAGEPSTGRVNLRAATDGLLLPDRGAIDRLNALDPRLTVSTLAEARVREGELVATVKVIPFFAPGREIARWDERARDATPLTALPWRPLSVAHLSTTLPGLKQATLDKTRRVFEGRLEWTGAALGEEVRVEHERVELARALREVEGAGLIVIFGASAVTDTADVVPAAIECAGGTVERVGMPVDPGNLLVLARLEGAVVIGAPGCARSPVRNGFDIVLDRVLAGVEVGSDDIARMGVGGLLKEIASRPRPRERRRGASDKS